MSVYLNILRKSLPLAGKWLHPDQIQSFPNFLEFLFPLSIRLFFRIPIQNGCE